MFKILIRINCLIIPVLVCALLISPVMALSVGHIGGKGLNPEVEPGEQYSQRLSVKVAENDAPTDVLIEILGYRDGDSGVEPVSILDDTNKYSAVGFIEPKTTTVHCEPGDSKEAIININIPPDAASGGRYAVIRFSTVPKNGNSIGIISAIVLPLKFTIEGDTLIHSANIVGLNVNKTVSGQSIELFTAVKNTGTHHFNMKGQIEIRDPSDKLIDTIYFNSFSPIPESIKNVKTVYLPKQELPLGTYSLKSKIMLEDGTVLDEAEGSFEVKAPYIPPPPPASVNLKPSSAATLQTDDGRIIINFPQGSVLGEAKVSLQSYPPEQLPSPPAGLSTATTCFRVDGLNGLLTKEAKVTVKYSSADLQKAGGDASKLQLARWDEASNEWTILKTSVDKPTMTLTTSTNQFSLWAVMVGTPMAVSTNPSASPVNSMLFVIIGLATIVITVAVILVIRKRKG